MFTSGPAFRLSSRAAMNPTKLPPIMTVLMFSGLDLVV
jgi:hypothetical protein